MVFAVMKKKDQQSYEVLFRYLKENFGMSSDNFTTDYEKALANALAINFPEANLMGCWFHLAQVRFKKKVFHT